MVQSSVRFRPNVSPHVLSPRTVHRWGFQRVDLSLQYHLIDKVAIPRLRRWGSLWVISTPWSPLKITFTCTFMWTRNRSLLPAVASAGITTVCSLPFYRIDKKRFGFCLHRKQWFVYLAILCISKFATNILQKCCANLKRLVFSNLPKLLPSLLVSRCKVRLWYSLYLWRAIQQTLIMGTPLNLWYRCLKIWYHLLKDAIHR